MKKIHQTLASPRAIDRSPNLYRGVIMKLSDVAVDDLVAVDVNAERGEEGKFANWGENSGTYATSDIRTARLYADTGALINRQTNKLATRNKKDWTVGVVGHIDNKDNDLGFDRAKPRKWIAKLDKWITHYVMGRTEYITADAIPTDRTSVREVYLFQGGKLYAKFDTNTVALESVSRVLSAHYRHLNGDDRGEPIPVDEDAKIDRVISSISV